MATPNQPISTEIQALQSRISDLQSGVRLAKVRDAFEDLQTTVNGMAQRLAGLRTRGYVFEKDLEIQARSFTEAWNQLSPNVRNQIETQSTLLTGALRPIELQLTQLAASAGNPAAAGGLLSSLKVSVGQLDDKVRAAEATIAGMYDQFSNQVTTVVRHLDEIEYLLTQLAEATFQLLPTEGGILAVKAVWCKSGKEQKDDPQGVLFLTDQRLIFEQKQEVATKKVLGIATEKQMIQKLELETPVTLVEKIDPSKQGLLKNEDHVEVHFASGAPFDSIHFHLWHDNAAWSALVNRARSKDFDAGRAVAIDQAAVDRVKAAPAQCPNCGGNLNQTVLRGQDSIKCEYCGFVIRL